MYDNNYPNDYSNQTGSGPSEAQNGYGSRGEAQSRYGMQETGQGSYGAQETAQGRYGSQGALQRGYGVQETTQSSYGSRSTAQSGYGSQETTQNRYGSQDAAQSNYGGQSAAQGSYGSEGNYHYGNVYPNNYAQTMQKPEKKKKEKKQGGGYFKKALVMVSLGLFFGVFAGLGLYTVEYATGMLDNKTEAVDEAAKTAETGKKNVETAADEGTQSKADSASIKQSDTATTVVTDVTEVVKNVMPSIVAVNNHYTETMSWFGQSMDSEADASGSGIIVGLNDSELLIVTNYHVVEDTDKLTVQFNEGSEAEAFIKGQDSKMDLAVIAVPVTEMSDSTLQAIEVATLGNSDDLEVGEPAIAIGNSLGYGQSVTTGVISALDRSINLSASNGYGGDNVEGTFIQTDAAINPGNSGGALLNIKGEVIGINSNKIGGSAVEGMGYAIPISAASPIIAELMLKETKSKVAEDERGYLGISGISVTQEVSQAYGMPEGVYIAQVYPDTAAAAAGLKQGDIITEFGGDKIASMEELQKELEFYAKGSTVEVKVMTMTVAGYEEITVQLTLGNKVAE
ncbi:MAG: trypsin-like peptidase domain-containing protein [Lachnospiraceae bacterium]|nr:trypsin-like peptidase domain-containing protein [Lachnospiraceae bacterium]